MDEKQAKAIIKKALPWAMCIEFREVAPGGPNDLPAWSVRAATTRRIPDGITPPHRSAFGCVGYGPTLRVAVMRLLKAWDRALMARPRRRK